MSIERSRLDLLQSVQDVHKQDINTYVSGHLNQSKLKLPESETSNTVSHERWTSSTQPSIRLKPASHPVHKPVRKGQLSRARMRRKTMMDTVAEFSFGALGCYLGSSDDGENSTDITPGMSSNSTYSSVRKSKDIMKGTFVEELKLPEIMLSTKGGSMSSIKTGAPSKRHFIKSYLSQVTKEEQYDAMKNFEKTVMKVPDANDKGLLTGDRIVRKLQKRLNKKLQPLHDSCRRGPNFHRLQAYSDCFSQIIEQSTTFSRLLKMIKDEYDSYLAYILDENTTSQHQELYSQMPSLSKAKSVAQSIQKQQNILHSLEDNVCKLLTDNNRLRKRVREEKKKPVLKKNLANVADNVVKMRVHVEELPKDFQEQVEDFHSKIADQLESLEKMRKYQRDNCVPSSVCQHFEQCIKDTDVDIQKLLKQNEFLEQSIEELELDLHRIFYSSVTLEDNANDYWKSIQVSKVLEFGSPTN